MKFSIAAAMLALGLAGTSQAASAYIDQQWTTGPWLIPAYHVSYYGDDGKRYAIKANFPDGCKGTQYSWIKQMCIDQDRKRAHVTYSGGSRNCFKATKTGSTDCGGKEGCRQGQCPKCHHWIYSKVKCTW